MYLRVMSTSPPTNSQETRWVLEPQIDMGHV